MRNKLLVIERQVDYMDKIAQMKEKIAEADAVVIGAGAGLSTAALRMWITVSRRQALIKREYSIRRAIR